MFPNVANDSTDVEMSQTQQDSLFRWQLSQENPKVLNGLSFFMGGVTESKTISAKVHSALKKNGVIDPTTGTINTANITKYFAHQLAVLPVHRQRKLVCMLFWWEEELVRWRLLGEEAAEITQAVALGGEGEDLTIALQVVEAKRTMLPSIRKQDPKLPSYTERVGC
ncbi:MAG: hypothetical protein M1840_008534 [Geoglossum simile]|nr:MAG: hypothetical protein M1840_008534 [Geoglossum simile]